MSTLLSVFSSTDMLVRCYIIIYIFAYIIIHLNAHVMVFVNPSPAIRHLNCFSLIDQYSKP